MARITFVHWGTGRADALVRALSLEGHDVREESRRPDHIWQPLRDDPGDLVVLSLLEKPAWAEQVADATKTSRMQGVPLVFLTEDPVPERLGREHPDAIVSTPDDLALMVRRALPAGAG